MYTTNYDNWLMSDPTDKDALQYQREREITKIMDDQNLDWDDAESYYDDMVAQAEKDHIESLAEDRLSTTPS